MPRNGSGTMERVHDWTDDAGAGVPMTASRFDDDIDDIADELTNSVAKDGQTIMTGNLNMGNNRVVAAANGTARTDGATVGQLQDNTAVYISSTGSANAYVLTPTPAITVYTAGQEFKFKANFSNTGAATVNVSGLGAKDIKKNVSVALDSGDIVNGQEVNIRYDGTNFQLLGSGNVDGKTLTDVTLKDYAETRVAANSSTAYTVDLEAGNVSEITLTGNCTFTFSNPSASGKGCSFTLILRQDGTGGRTVTWPASVDWEEGAAPTLTTTASAVNILSFVTTDAGTTWWGFLAGKNMS